MSCEQGVHRGQQLGYGEVGPGLDCLQWVGLTRDFAGVDFGQSWMASCASGTCRLGHLVSSPQAQHKQKLNRSPHSCPAKRGWPLDLEGPARPRQIRKPNKTQIAATAVTRQPHKHRIWFPESPESNNHSLSKHQEPTQGSQNRTLPPGIRRGKHHPKKQKRWTARKRTTTKSLGYAGVLQTKGNMPTQKPPACTRLAGTPLLFKVC